MIPKRQLTAWAKFNRDVEAFIATTEGSDATLYEDAFISRHVRDFNMTPEGVLTWTEDGKRERETMRDEDESREWLSFWRKNLRRAKRYWEMDTETLDKIQDGEIEDKEDEE